MIEATMRTDPILAIIPGARRLKRPGATMWYCRTDEGLPGRALPDGYYLVHNQVARRISQGRGSANSRQPRSRCLCGVAPVVGCH